MPSLVALDLRPHNAAPEWQEGSMGWPSEEMAAPCPLEGLVRSVIDVFDPITKGLSLLTAESVRQPSLPI
jgi:hypothetical protein